MSQLDFDFNSFQSRVEEQQRQALAEASKGLKALEQKRDEVCDEISQLEERRDDLDLKISRLREFVSAETPLVDVLPITSRNRGLQRAIMEEVFEKKLSVSDWLGLEDVTVLVKDAFPAAHESSVRQALRNLVQKDELEVSGKRGNRVWRVPVVQEAPADGTEMHPDLTTAPTEPAPIFGGDSEDGIPMPPSAGDVMFNAFQRLSRQQEDGIPMPPSIGDVMFNAFQRLSRQQEGKRTLESGVDESDVMVLRDRLCNAILEELKKRPGGLDAKAIAWLIDQEKATEDDFQNAVQTLLGAKQVELAQGDNGDGQVVRLPVDPDSREGLKQVRVEGNSLFPGMEKPKHA